MNSYNNVIKGLVLKEKFSIDQVLDNNPCMRCNAVLKKFSLQGTNCNLPIIKPITSQHILFSGVKQNK